MHEITIKRSSLKEIKIDIEGRDILIGFNEPPFKKSQKSGQADLDSKLNARFISYFLPAVQVANNQKKRPRLFVVSGLNMALKWNASSLKQQKIMTINNNLKFDFLARFFENFYPKTFSLIEFVVAQDPIKTDDEKLLKVWKILEKKYPTQIEEIKLNLARFRKPKLFNTKHLRPEAKKYLKSNKLELLNSFKYAISHLFALGDINFEGNIIHNDLGYLTIGGSQEKVFNLVRKFASEVIPGAANDLFEKELIIKNNIRLVLEKEIETPPAYTGYYKNNRSGKPQLEEVTYENKRQLNFYDKHKSLHLDMNYIYKNFISQSEYQKFWNHYRKSYYGLKARYEEAYGVNP
jgi:hypothetical protein